MSYNSNQLQLQFQGYLNTPLLWESHSVMGIYQLELPQKPIVQFKAKETPNARLGKRVEQFVFSELDKYDNINIRLENLQIQKNKQTIGEIDCILERDQQLIHLEIVYKFYLYDPTQGNTEIEHWVGPNRNDSLIKKLTKLRDKQLPLIKNPSATKALVDLNVNTNQLSQYVYFKAQLFVPYDEKLPKFNLLNKSCLNGYYIHYSRINMFENCKFFIPHKIDWLQTPISHVNWLTYSSFNEEITTLINNKIAPLCWIKFPNGEKQKYFVVWWND
ncbi:DUF1853 family protein [Tamlana sp. 2_MG-2023]|uniref:DUF1853 family protein n=1 Tax=unclassified Tamlana TaxID=2614803 RepID=UPI0026E3F5AA|nr:MULTISPECIES: DUF1853 family protein [unclassified Tamlana]MDO6759479.1 DUF1853 family protein [Tamlana sp. 2_MG-2023]MDO6790382.1 DUF1853 family protein [Tamlana sp. 1_MG-2023]